MAELFLLDTSAWIISFRAASVLKIKPFIESLLSERRVVTCGIVMLELLQGAVSESEYKKLFADFSALDFAQINSAVWEVSYKIGFEIKRKGSFIPATDCLIASIAMDGGLKLLHADKHFDIIQKYAPLEAVNILHKFNFG